MKRGRDGCRLQVETFIGSVDTHHPPLYSMVASGPNASLEEQLSEELIAFASFLTPDKSERANREEITRRLSDAVRNKWPKSKVEAFGSTAAGLDSFCSDVDLCVLGDCGSRPVNELACDIKGGKGL